MAKYTLPLSGTRRKGSKGGNTFQRSGSTFVIRKHNVPTNKKRLRQISQRQLLASNSSKFKTLSVPEQQSFDDEAPNFQRTNSLGVNYTLRANQLQISSNNLLIGSNSTPISEMVPPVVYPGSVFGLIDVNNSANTSVFYVLAPSTVPADFSLAVFLTRPLSEGVIPADVDYRLCYTVPEGVSTLGNRMDEYRAVFGDTSNQVGQRVWGQFFYISTLNGQRGIAIQGSGTVSG